MWSRDSYDEVYSSDHQCTLTAIRQNDLWLRSDKLWVKWPPLLRLLSLPLCDSSTITFIHSWMLRTKVSRSAPEGRGGSRRDTLIGRLVLLLILVPPRFWGRSLLVWIKCLCTEDALADPQVELKSRQVPEKSVGLQRQKFEKVHWDYNRNEHCDYGLPE